MNISTFQSNLDFIKSLYFHEEWKDEDCKKEILEALEEANDKIEKAFGESMYRLGWKHKPSTEAVEKVVQKFASTLLFEQDEDGQIPIQYAATAGAGFEYVSILANEGVKYKVGEEDTRGGLLIADPTEIDGWNALKMLSSAGDEDDDRLRVLKELQKSGLLVKKDIQEQNLLEVSCWEENQKRFEYFASWDPDALIETRIEDEPLIHYMSSSTEKRIILLLKAGFKYHPNKGGLLFVEDDQGTTAFDCLCSKKEVDKVMSLLYDILSPKRNYPILHHIFVNAPQHINIFMRKFPWAYHLRDHNGRTLHQAVLAAGPDVMKKNDFLLASLSDNQIQTKDSITTLYPFAAMAVGEHADLENTFYLLRRQPSVMDRHSRSDIGSSSNRRKKRRIQKQQVK
ncbi:hypothetical protein CTEN210_00550 [Chaetoceros tenuissimus]|uniref:Uncharacterized protein n=1 Tax=Chaetoceros tenuissimus TaxID=426638 RepID=A0AAD3CFX5_9STRA|nr:hypothetical protein CTEN210_00550 [Chaetoceros tenuissimus]